ncbi:hypothetical protein FNU79_10240 [Deinococcus detaillensis]|uniref:Uncharacterized protein n=1 Tax=Deinococcus detaillensis TaxID=2592048 RepID=A0A553UWM5_9DEIO|nr:hypothetical protein [Deinococcus detaillensis]TSA84608.1 hypothetical protein FNU79_10240 [Deinococcus detaillensis]
MNSTVTISLLSSLTLFLGLTALARWRVLGRRRNLVGAALALIGVLGAGWLMFNGAANLAVPAALIGVLGYFFGHVTTPRPTDPSKSSPSSQLP